jgi:hypothetical protein
MFVWERVDQRAVDDAENGGVGADPDGEREHGRDGERRAAPEVPQSVAHIAAQQIEVLPAAPLSGCRESCPTTSKCGHGASMREDVSPLLVERGGHIVAEVAAEVRGEQPEQAAEEPVRSGHYSSLSWLMAGWLMAMVDGPCVVQLGHEHSPLTISHQPSAMRFVRSF